MKYTSEKYRMETKDITLENPLKKPKVQPKSEDASDIYGEAVQLGQELQEKPLKGGGTDRITVQHSKDRMTVWERIKVLTKEEPNILYQNWQSFSFY